MHGPKSIAEIDFAELTRRKYTPSPDCWSDQVLYFLMLDRFADGNERGGYQDVQDQPVTTGSTRLATSGDAGVAPYEQWLGQGEGWQGGTLKGLKSKLGYLRRLGVTAIWISPVFKQVAFEPTYHGYGIQNFLEIDPHFGTREDLRELVDAAHQQGIYCILDVILNHAGNVFGYRDVRYLSRKSEDEWIPDPRWDGQPYKVEGFHDRDGKPTLSFGPPDPAALDAAWPDGAIWPREFQTPDNFMCQGRISNWDYYPEFNDADFFDLKKLNLKVDWSGEYPRYSPTLRYLIYCYMYWIAYADIDGFRIDTVKHMGQESTRMFCAAIHEMAQSLGKERFLLAGEVTGGRHLAWSMVDSTGLDAALGIEDIPGRLELMVKGLIEPGEYFGLFRNSELDDHGDFAWYGQHVVTMFDDHDQVRKGDQKRRFCGMADFRNLAFNALAVNLTTPGIPCIYYGTEQGFDSGGRPSPIDTVLRENMFGGRFGAKCSQGVHFFDENAHLFQAISKLADLRRNWIALRRGRQYMHEISGDGVHFGPPTKFGDRLQTLVAWSRVMADNELLVVFNTDEVNQHEIYSTLNPNLRREGDELRLLFSYTPEVGVEPAESPRYALPTLKVVRQGNVLCTRLALGPAGYAIYAAGKFLVGTDQPHDGKPRAAETSTQ
jgi:glycosidase